MKTSRLVGFFLLFLSANTTDGQVYKIYDHQRVLDDVMNYGLKRLIQKDSAKLYQIGTDEVKSLQTFLQEVYGGCFYDTTGAAQIGKDILERQLKIIRKDSLMKDISSYRDSISAQFIGEYLETYGEKESAHLVEKGSVIYHEGPLLEDTKKIIAFMRANGVRVLAIQRYYRWLEARTRHYELKDLFKKMVN
ncbi:MAG: hypothetical protein AB8H12_05605 [Lewinella sp.]